MAVRARDWFSAFAQVDKAVWLEATEEVATISIVSLFPLLLAGVGTYLAKAVNAPGVANDFGAAIWATISSGQLVFYAISAVATVMYYASRDFKRNFPLRLYYIVISLAFCIFAALLIGIDPTLRKLNVPEITWTSILIYVIASLLYWTICVFRSIDPADYDQSLREGEEQTTDDLRTLREGQP